ncbi:MAG TPA: fused MFS/spermidine synthase [Urbifossiella sp.]|nr:fused MFS/spermidine synthase [Urbifossiella sp.]
MLPALFAATLFVGAALLFLVQPLAGKLLLPLVGGTPGVWNACMVFFQLLLLAGYLYAHKSVTRLGVRRQAAVHLGLLVVVLVAFQVAAGSAGSPVPVFASLVPDDSDYPIAGALALLTAAVGVPFFVLATTSPLLQRWFAATGHRAAHDPYFLYAASNAGSLLGLLAYPLLIEPNVAVADQRWFWAVGVGGYLGMVLVCALVVRRSAGTSVPEPEPEPVPGSTPHPFRWVALAALPSSLLLGVTTHVSTDLAPVPLLWVVPLALYLVSFIVVFARWPDRVHRGVGRVTPMLVLFVVVGLLTDAAEPMWLVSALHLLAFFGVCLVCHGELAKDRPPAHDLTRFYFYLSLGGVVGGLFNALVAPLLFHRLGMVEYPLALVLAMLVRPGAGRDAAPFLKPRDVAFVLGLLVAAAALVRFVPQLLDLPAELDAPEALTARLTRNGLMFGVPAVLAFALVRRPMRYALALAALFVAGSLDPGQLGRTLHMERNFFGVVRVTRSADGTFVRLVHGTTLHGQQRTDEPGPPRPMTYYHERGPVGHLFRTVPAERVRRVAVVGLGTGAVAAYAKPGQAWTFYEIDPSVKRIAEDPAYFRFLSSCKAASCDVVLGDARRMLARAPDGAFDVILLDAFSSDAIPVHLLTREALALYVRKLAPGGVLAVHVSNVHLNLPPLVDRLAADHAPPLAARYWDDHPTDEEKADGKTASQWMVLARGVGDLGVMARGPQWHPVRAGPGPVWRDDFANVLGVWKRDDPDN